jgi:hypothetical protein
VSEAELTRAVKGLTISPPGFEIFKDERELSQSFEIYEDETATEENVTAKAAEKRSKEIGRDPEVRKIR